jgi:ketosteroid isomerase-like protein
MTKWVIRVGLLVALCAVAFWLWRILVPTQEQIIRKRLAQIAQVASFSGKESPLAKLGNAQQLANFCAPDAEIAVEIPGHAQAITGQEEIRQAALAARAAASSVQIEFLDVNVAVDPGKQSAIAHLTAKGRVQGEQVVEELKFTFRKVEGKWLIQRVERVKTLS